MYPNGIHIQNGTSGPNGVFVPHGNGPYGMFWSRDTTLLAVLGLAQCVPTASGEHSGPAFPARRPVSSARKITGPQNR